VLSVSFVAFVFLAFAKGIFFHDNEHVTKNPNYFHIILEIRDYNFIFAAKKEE